MGDLRAIGQQQHRTLTDMSGQLTMVIHVRRAPSHERIDHDSVIGLQAKGCHLGPPHAHLLLHADGPMQGAGERRAPQLPKQLEHHRATDAVVDGLAAYTVGVGHRDQGAVVGHRITHGDAHASHVGGRVGPHIDVEIVGGQDAPLLLRRLQVARLDPDDTHEPTNAHAPPHQHRGQDPAQGIEAQKTALIDALDDAPDLIRMGGNEKG